MNFDSETSAALARRVRAQFRRCWRNAALAVSHLGPEARYAEGWIVTDGVHPYVIEHGWCEVDGRIVDPSYTAGVSPYRPPVAYFAGMRCTADEVAAALQSRRLPMVWASDDREHAMAFEAAWCDAARRGHAAPWAPTRVVHCRREPHDVFVGRPSPWGNPFFIGRDGTREEVIEKFRWWFIRQPSRLHDVSALRGKVLGCDCKPLPCHGDVLAELADLPLADRRDGCAASGEYVPAQHATGHSPAPPPAGADI